MPGLAHPHHHDFPAAVENLLAGVGKILINVLIELFQPFPFNLQNFFSRLQEIEIRLQIYLRHSVIPIHSMKSGVPQ